MTTPAVEGLLTTPYVSVAEFRSAPTYLDSSNLIPGGVQANQDAELYNVLLRASAWADSYCGQTLRAHTVWLEQTRTRVGKYGQIYLHPSNTPVRQVIGVAMGSDFMNLQVLGNLAQTWVEDARGIVITSTPQMSTTFGSLQFGSLPAQGREIFVQYAYIAGYCNTTLSASVGASSSTVQVVDPTGLQPPATNLLTTAPGSPARIWDPGLEEAVVVSSAYTAGNSTVNLVTPTINAHTVGSGPSGQVSFSEMPAEIHQAVIALAVGLLCRDDTVSDEEPYPGTSYGPTTRASSSGGKAGGLVETAWQLLYPYKRVR